MIVKCFPVVIIAGAILLVLPVLQVLLTILQVLLTIVVDSDFRDECFWTLKQEAKLLPEILSRLFKRLIKYLRIFVIAWAALGGWFLIGREYSDYKEIIREAGIAAACYALIHVQLFY